MVKWILAWHTFRARYHEVLLEGCLDMEMKRKLQLKIDYHKNRVDSLMTP